MLEKITIISLILFCFFLVIFYLAFGVYLAIFENKKLEKLIYPKNSAVHVITDNGGIPVGFMKAGEYGLHFALLGFFRTSKNKNRLKIELRDAPKKLRIKYLIFFWESVFWVFYATALYVTGTMLGW